MNKSIFNIRNLVIAASVFAVSQTHAATENVNAEVTFVSPVSIVENNPLQFGLLDAGLANAETVVIATDDSVTDAASNVLGGAQAAADLTVAATAGQSINISISSIVNGTGYALGSFTCNYDGNGSGACGAETSVASATLEIGATLTGDGNAVAGAANGSFDVVIDYQ